MIDGCRVTLASAASNQQLPEFAVRPIACPSMYDECATVRCQRIEELTQDALLDIEAAQAVLRELGSRSDFLQ